MKKICFVTTVSLTIRAFVLPVIRYLSEYTDWEITVICHEDSQLQEQLHFATEILQLATSLLRYFSAAV
jgi:hypothetical protein